MDSCTMRIGSSMVLPPSSSSSSLKHRQVEYVSRFSQSRSVRRLFAVIPNGSVSSSASPEAESRAVGDAHRRRSSLESLFCYDKPVPEERIEKPVGISLSEKEIGDNTRCSDCEAKGAILCATCAGSGLYVDSILESQGIIVKVRCLGCGGTGNVMCADCGGRGHLGSK
ncbi:DnaJ/Hsp40 cysteine-rich domain superfamily protein [Euphorbia peplus]|nr:DnaJ/Hsp40 cysteine-rich domain superfamily protein [Euphorbia peplus]